MSIAKDFQYPVSLQWEGGRLTRVANRWRQELEVATPPEFAHGMEDVWSPEDLLVAAAASCYAVTFLAVAERREIPIRSLKMSGTGHLSRRDDGRLGFVVIELDAEIETDAASLRAAESAAERAKDACFVANALDVPVHVGVMVRPALAVTVG